MARKRKKIWFAWILIIGAVAITWTCWHVFVMLVDLWDWPLSDLRYTMHGKRTQSAFSMLSMISGILGGLCLANYYQRRDLNSKLFLVPFLATLLSILELRGMQLLGLPLENSTSVHFSVILLWLIHIFGYFYYVRDKKSGKK